MPDESKRCPDCGEPLGVGEPPHVPEECIAALRMWIDVLRDAVRSLAARVGETESVLGI